MTIADSDGGGGAGVQADLRTFAFHFVDGISAIIDIIYLTAQSTVDVLALTPIELFFIEFQVIRFDN